MIINIQILRGFAALAVAFYHTGLVLPGLRASDFHGVAIFFVISGFIMTYITREAAAGFLFSRITRIVPLYWIALLTYVLIYDMGLMNPNYTWPVLWNFLLNHPSQIGIWFMQHTRFTDPAAIVDFMKDLLFIPRFDATGAFKYPALPIGWTLNLEVFFYALFAISLAVDRRAAPLIVAAALSALIIAARLFDLGPLLTFYSVGYVAYFILGIAVYYAWRAFDVGTLLASSVLLTGVCVLLASAALPSATPNSNFEEPAWCYVGPAFLVLGALLLETSDRRLTYRPILELGAASYALYLFHLFLLETARAAGGGWIAAMCFAVSPLLALVIYRLIEKPMIELARSVKARDDRRGVLRSLR